MLGNKKEYISILHNMFISSGEYKFKDKSNELSFLREVLSDAEDLYQSEHWYREYVDFKDFLYTHHVDSIAHWATDNYELTDDEDEE